MAASKVKIVFGSKLLELRAAGRGLVELDRKGARRLRDWLARRLLRKAVPREPARKVPQKKRAGLTPKCNHRLQRLGDLRSGSFRKVLRRCRRCGRATAWKVVSSKHGGRSERGRRAYDRPGRKPG